MCMSISKGLLTPLGVSGLLWAFLDAFVYLETLLCFFAEEQMNGRTDGRTDGRAGRRTDRRTDERTSGRTGGCAKVSKALQGTTLFTIDKCSTVTQGWQNTAVKDLVHYWHGAAQQVKVSKTLQGTTV